MDRKTLRTVYAAIPLKRQVFRIVRRIARVPKPIYQHLHFTGAIDIPLEASSFRIWSYGYQIENDLFWAGYGNGFEGTSLRLWARLAGSSRTIFDIGANTGVYALAAAAINPSATIWAFEPVARIADKLERNVGLNKAQVKVVRAAASAQTGQADIYDSDGEHEYSASLDATMMAGVDGVSASTIHAVRIDDFMLNERIPSVGLVKLDVEKHEPEALAGFGDVIARCRPTFLIEVLDRDVGGRVEPYFNRLGYRFFEIDEGREVRCVPSLGLRQGNYLVCSADVADVLGLGDCLAHDKI